MIRFRYACVLLVVVIAVGCSSQSKQQTSASSDEVASADGMKAPSDFASIEDEKARSRALFAEIGKVLKHPRCMNCHPDGEVPLMGDESKPHQPVVKRGEDGFGEPGMRCMTCHGRKNYKNVPGHPNWHVAPAEMAWEGKSLRSICKQIKDPERNGGKTIDELVEHMATDSLVAYGWDPPDHYEPVPGSQELFGKLARSWADNGAHCPKPDSE